MAPSIPAIPLYYPAFLASRHLFIYIYGIIGSYQVFDQVFVMTSGGPIYSTSTVVYYLFDKFRDLRLGYASAIAYILFAILVIFSYLADAPFTREEIRRPR